MTNSSERTVRATGAASTLVIVSALLLLLISYLIRSTWEWKSVWMVVLAVLPAAPFFIPCTETGKDLLSSFSKTLPLFLFGWYLITDTQDSNFFHSGTAVLSFGLAFALLVFAGKGKGLLWVFLAMVYAMAFALLIYTRTASDFSVFCIGIITLLLLVSSSASGWLGKEWKWLYAGVSFASPVAMILPLSSEGTAMYLDYLERLAYPYSVDYLGVLDRASIQEHLSYMPFIGRTYPLEPNGLAEPYDYPLLESRLLVIMGHRIGWIAYLIVGALIVMLAFGLILLAVRRKGLGKALSIAGVGAIVVPLILHFVTNLGGFDAQTSYVPLLSGNFAVNLVAVLLLRLAVTFKPDPECYSVPPKGNILYDFAEDEDEDRKEWSLGELSILAIPKDQYIKTIADAFDGQIAIPFKKNLLNALEGKELLFSRYHGGLQDIIDIFSQLKLQGKAHFVRVAVSEQSNISRLLFGVERVTHAMSNQNNVDFCVCIDESIPANTYSILVVSVKSEDEA